LTRSTRRRRRRSSTIETLVEQTNDHLVIFIGSDATDAYVCDALHHGSYSTLFPYFDRRAWVFEQQAETPIDGFILADVTTPGLCSFFSSHGARSCGVDAGDSQLLVVGIPRQPFLGYWNSIDGPVRCPFGPPGHCEQSSGVS
jgi:hypothetical protein